MGQCQSPEWQPLLEFASEHIDDFMWMHEVELEGGDRLHAYKHYWTRRYLHLDDKGRAFVYVDGGRYREVDPSWLLDLVLLKDRPGPPPYDIVRQNLWSGSLELQWARSASRHRISRERSRYVIENCDLLFDEAPPPGSRTLSLDLRVVFLGDDQEGVALEVMAVELDDNALLVIHAMRLRKRYRERYEEANKWRR